MNATLARTELKLFLRDPSTTLFGLLLPVLILAGLGAVPALRESSPTFGGESFLTAFAPSLLSVSMATLGLQLLPSTLVGYRERGVLRRYATTPVRPVEVLAVQLVISLVTAVVGACLMLAVAVLCLGVPVPAHPLGFVAAFVVGTVAVFAVGMIVAALAPRVAVSGALGSVMMVACLFFAGVYLPPFLLPEWVNRISEFVPPGVAVLREAWTGGGPQPVALLVMAGIAVAATAVAARCFRWQ